MVLRPVNNRPKNMDKGIDENINVESFMDDNIVIVAFPSCLWNSIKEISEKLEITTNEVLGNAIKEYCERNNI
jgi:hypothetical protein